MVSGRPAHPSRTVLVAVNPFKESFSAVDVADACGRAVRSVGWSADLMPGADGGDGLLDALRYGRLVDRTTRYDVPGPTGAPVTVEVDWLDAGTAVIESRLVVGLGLVPADRRDPGLASTRGLGELIQRVTLAGAREVVVGLGGSATMDGGVGMASVWGWSPRDAEGRPLEAVGAGLDRLDLLEPGVPVRTGITALIDVDNPLLGPEGASVYARQKGATPTRTAQIEAGLARVVRLLGPPGARMAEEAGAGAAGGLGFGLRYFGGARFQRGAVWMLDRLGFSARLSRADLVITAEAGFDATSARGKLPGFVLGRARAAGIPGGLLSPTATHVPTGVVVESGGGWWDLDEVESRTRALLERLGRLPPP